MKFDIAVIGGGFSGLAAAIAAAREGSKVILIEKGNCMGGAASLCLVQHFMDYTTKINGEQVILSRGTFNCGAGKKAYRQNAEHAFHDRRHLQNGRNKPLAVFPQLQKRVRNLPDGVHN